MSVTGTPLNYETTAGSVATTFAADAGVNRIVGLVFNHEQATSATRYLSTVQLGGQSATYYARHVHNLGFVEFWFIPESAIANIGSNPTLTITTNGGSGVVAVTIFTVVDCDQNTANWTNAVDQNTAAVALSINLATTSGGTVLGGLTQTSGSNSTSFTGATEVTGSDRNINAGAARAATFYADATSSTIAITGDSASTSSSFFQLMLAVGIPPSPSGATISSGTPSGTIATQRRATLGATSTQSTGTFYAVLSSNQADITGITAAQVFAGQYAGGGAATFAGNNTVSDLTPDVLITGLTPATTYYYAIMHRVGSSNSNVIDSGSFTTAVATSTASLTLRDGAGALLNGQTLNFWTRTGLNTAAVDGGSGGLSVTCNASGVFTFSGLSVDAGPGFITVQNPTDNTYSANYPVTFVAGV